VVGRVGPVETRRVGCSDATLAKQDPGRMIGSLSSCGYFLGAGMTPILSGNQTLHQTWGDSHRPHLPVMPT